MSVENSNEPKKNDTTYVCKQTGLKVVYDSKHGTLDNYLTFLLDVKSFIFESDLIVPHRLNTEIAKVVACIEPQKKVQEVLDSLTTDELFDVLVARLRKETEAFTTGLSIPIDVVKSWDSKLDILNGAWSVFNDLYCSRL